MAKVFCVSYTFYVSVLVEDIEKSLDIKWQDVDTYYVKWNILHITMQNKDTLEYPLPEMDSDDIKYPEECEVYDNPDLDPTEKGK